MKKIDVSYINKEKKEDAILKIKEDSCTIVTENDELIKVPFSNIKSHKYDDGVLTISRYGGSNIKLEMAEDKAFFENLKNIEKENKDNVSKENDTDKKEKNKVDKPEANEEKEEEPKVVESNNNQENKSNNGSIVGAIIFLILVVIGIRWFINLGNESDKKSKEESILTAEFINSAFSTESKKENLYGGTVHQELQFNEDGTVFLGMCYSKTGKCSGTTEYYKKNGLDITITRKAGDLHYSCYFNSNSEYKLYCKHSNGYTYEDFSRIG